LFVSSPILKPFRPAFHRIRNDFMRMAEPAVSTIAEPGFAFALGQRVPHNGRHAIKDLII